MIDDFRPAPGPAKSLRDKLDELPKTKPPQAETATETFRTPEEVAAAQDIQVIKPTIGTVATKSETDPGPQPVEPIRPVQASPTAAITTTSSWRDKLALSWPPGKKELLVAVTVIVLLGGGVAAWYVAHSHAKAAPVVVKKVVKPPKKVAPVVPTTVPSTLSGLPVSPSVNQLPVTAVMIENSDFARPQSGLGQASVVFEAIAEGGITRFLTLFQDTSPDNVGPIRSARPYYVQWALGFDPGYAHVGGSPEALSDIKSWGVHDLDQFYNGGSYHRITSRAAPHNVYTSIATLNQLETAKGYTSSTFTGFPRKPDAPAKQPTAATVKLNISGPDYNVVYTYDPATNSYKRAEGGAAHVDANTNTQISPKVVIAMVMQYGLEADDHHSSYNVIGSGPVSVFQDGTLTTGQWTKASSTSQITFTDATGTPIKLNTGQTWLTAVASQSAVSYTP